VARDERGNELCIVHRDVSPHNVLLDVEGRVRVADFGIARAAQRLSRTSTGQVKGKIGYLSPEQAQSLPVDRRSDVFSLGIVAWELLAGRRLFPKKNLVEQHRRLLHAPIEHPSDVAPAVPREVGDVVMGALERDLDRRTPDAATFGEHLRAIAPRRVPADVIGRFVEEHAREEVTRLRAIVDAVVGHGDTLHTLVLPAHVIADTGEVTRATGDRDREDTTVTPPRPQAAAAPARGWLSRLLKR
jgi:serine/threonine-protein kinase